MESRRDSTRLTYHRIWKLFNEFFIKLDVKPESWEERLVLFTGFLVNKNLKASTVRTYISAIRGVLAESRIKIKEDSYLISSLTKACKLRNDKAVIRLPISKTLLKLIIKGLNKVFPTQPYLNTLYKAIFSTAYYGLLRIGEVSESPHILLARNVHIGTNKNKLLLLLESSKTHNKGDKPQIVKINGYPTGEATQSQIQCPFKLMQDYLACRPLARTSDEQFFVFSDNSPVKDFTH